MSMTECKECQKPVSSQAAACPHCGYKAPKKRSLVVTLAAVGVTGLLAVKLGSAMNTFDPKPAADRFAAAVVPDAGGDTQDVGAKAACRDFVRARVNKPSTAQFPTLDRFDVTHSTSEGGLVTVSSSVTTSDGPRSFNCTAKAQGGSSWKAVEVAFFGG